LLEALFLSLVGVFHLLHVKFAGLGVIYDWGWVIFSDYAFCFFLDPNWGLPGLIDVLIRHVFEDWQEMPHIVARLIILFRKRDRRIAPVILIKEARAADPLPISHINSPIAIQQLILKHPNPLLPTQPKIASGNKTSHSVSGKMVNPALLPQLAHSGIDPGVARSALVPGFD
jgi:hypothetical protein